MTHSFWKRNPKPEQLAAIHVSCSKLFATHRPICTAITVRWAQGQVILVIRYHVHGQRGGSAHWDGSRTQRHLFHICCRQFRINNDGSKFLSAQLFSVLPLIFGTYFDLWRPFSGQKYKIHKRNCVLNFELTSHFHTFINYTLFCQLSFFLRVCIYI